MKLWEERLEHSHHDSSWDEKLKNGLGECQVILVAEGKYFQIYILKLLVLAETRFRYQAAQAVRCALLEKQASLVQNVHLESIVATCKLRTNVYPVKKAFFQVRRDSR